MMIWELLKYAHIPLKVTSNVYELEESITLTLDEIQVHEHFESICDSYWWYASYTCKFIFSYEA